MPDQINPSLNCWHGWAWRRRRRQKSSKCNGENRRNLGQVAWPICAAILGSSRDRHRDNNTCPSAVCGLDFQFCVDLLRSFSHTIQSDTFTLLQASFRDSGSVVFHLKNQIRRIPAKSHGNDGRFGVANGVASPTSAFFGIDLDFMRVGGRI